MFLKLCDLVSTPRYWCLSITSILVSRKTDQATDSFLWQEDKVFPHQENFFLGPCSLIPPFIEPMFHNFLKLCSWIIWKSCSFWCWTLLVGGINNHKNQWRSEYGKYYQSSWITFSWPFSWCNYSAMIKNTIKAYFYKRHTLLKIRLWVGYFIYFKFTRVSSKVYQSLHL